MQNGLDSRSARRTRNLFKKALIRLLETESFAYISVKDIVETADFNRTTFYNHYLDKFDLLDDLTQELLNGFADAIQKSFTNFPPNCKRMMKKSDIVVFDYISKNRHVLYICRRANDTIDLSQKCSQTAVAKLMEIWSPQVVDMDEQRLLSYTKIFCYGLMGTIYGWMDENLITASTDEVTQNFIDFYNHHKTDNTNK
jgi:AcrR family transcriptional regulator